MAALVNPASPGRGAWVPFLFSATLHGLAFLGFSLATSWNDSRPAGGSALIDTLVIEDEVQLSLALPDAAAPRSGPSSSGEEQEPAAPVIRVVGNAPSLAPVAASLPGAQDGGQPPTKASSPGPAGGIGGTGATFLQVPAQARSVVYVIDRSVSMGLSGSLEPAKRELLASLNGLPADARFQVILYNRHAEPLSFNGGQGLLPATEEFKRQAADLLAGVRAEGGTAHLAALQQALALRPDVIFFVTDADDLTPEQVRTLTRANHGRTAIHAVELGPGRRQGDGSLAALARDNRGTYRAVDVLAAYPPER